ncbi:uncharacterized protein LOC143230988 isoform X2 [Tachypleus tridentatus]|uniref:uncharacterized protein LOC143230988 isoform X2 n=1 Tax=Tachypleus tridentatus TaxID=6853 RepID=UPI003FD4135E
MVGRKKGIFQHINKIMEVLKIKVEPSSDDKQSAVLDVKLLKNEVIKMSPCMTVNFLEEGPTPPILEVDEIKMEQEESCSEVENTTEQSSDLEHDGIISEFSDSVNGEIHLDNLKYEVMSVKEEDESQKELQPDYRFEGTSGPKNYMNEHFGKKIKIKSGKLHKLSSSDLCDKTSSSEKDLKQNVLKSVDKIFNCIECGKDFDRKSILQKHEKVHSRMKPYNCVVCNKTFVTNCHLIIHQRIHTGEKPYSCEVCEKEFGTNSYLKIHQRIHTGEKPYSCVVCGKKFGSNSGLKIHEKVHTGEKPYRCMICGKEFGTSSDLKKHERVHTREKPYSCSFCDRKYTYSCSLKRHENTHS